MFLHLSLQIQVYLFVDWRESGGVVDKVVALSFVMGNNDKQMAQLRTPETIVLPGYQVRALDKCSITLGDIATAVQATIQAQCKNRQAHPVARVMEHGIEKDEAVNDPRCGFEISEVPEAIALQFSCTRSPTCSRAKDLRERTVTLVGDTISKNVIQPLG